MVRMTRGRTQALPAQSIENFARVTKSTISDISSKKVVASEPVSIRKRKAASIDEDETHQILALRSESLSPSSDDEVLSVTVQTKRACRRQEPSAVTPKPTPIRSTPRSKRVARLPSSKKDTVHPSEDTAVTQTKISFSRDKPTSTSLKSPEASKNSFPPHLAEFLSLHKAFLSTVALQFVHHGNSVPLDITTIAPHIARAWGKRAVTVEDIRRCVALQSSTISQAASPFIISDYGRGKVCVELKKGLGAASIKEEQLCRQFEDNLRALCAENAMDEMTDVDISFGSLSIADLPQAAITTMESSIRMHPAFAQGQRALSDLKSDMAAKQQQREVKQQAPGNLLLNPDGSKMSLLDRIRFKQLAKAGEPLPASGPELQRRAALSRVGDVAATISMLSLSSSLSLPRQAFTMGVITDKLKDSLRVPPSKEEGMACIRLIATEIAPEWLRIVTVGGRENVVVQRNSQPVDRIIHERVQKLLS